jgi:hypothetical protein
VNEESTPLPGAFSGGPLSRSPRATRADGQLTPVRDSLVFVSYVDEAKHPVIQEV